jgi:hypothetical protein
MGEFASLPVSLSPSLSRSPHMSPALELARTHLAALREELAAATAAGLVDNEMYQAHLEQEMHHAETAYVAAAVTEIASFRAQLSGPQFG